MISARDLAALVAADAFASAGTGRREALWEALGLGEKPPLFEAAEFERAEAELAPLGEREQVARDYASVGLSLRRHPMEFLRAELEAMGVSAAADVQRVPADTKIRVAGLVVTRQRPQTASGVVFVSIEDETGTANLIVPPQVFERDRLAARQAGALLADGSVERQGDVVHVKAWKLWEISEFRRLRTAPRSFH